MQVNLAELIGFETMFPGSIHNHILRPAATAISKRLGTWTMYIHSPRRVLTAAFEDKVHLTQPFSHETTDFLNREWGNSEGRKRFKNHATI